MLSILIPVYNINCVSLVRKLYEMALLTEFPFEILLADDASCRKVREENRVLKPVGRMSCAGTGDESWSGIYPQLFG